MLDMLQQRIKSKRMIESDIRPKENYLKTLVYEFRNNSSIIGESSHPYYAASISKHNLTLIGSLVASPFWRNAYRS